MIVWPGRVLYVHPILVRALVNWALTALAFAITAWLLAGMTIHGGVLAYLWVSLLFGLVNVVAGTILRLLTLPLALLTFGLSLFLVNAVVLVLIAIVMGTVMSSNPSSSARSTISLSTVRC